MMNDLVSTDDRRGRSELGVGGGETYSRVRDSGSYRDSEGGGKSSCKDRNTTELVHELNAEEFARQLAQQLHYTQSVKHHILEQ